MKRIGKKKRRRGHRGHEERTPHPPLRPLYSKKKGTPGWIKALVALFFLGVIVAVGVWQFSPKGSTSQSPSPPPPQQPYPTYATGVFYNNPTITDSGTKIQLPHTFIKDKKIVFIDAALSSSRSDLQYQGRTIPLNLYRGGNYLPLIALYTPLGNTKVGIRTCEPCGSFSMHIGEGKYLICDACGTKWNLETFNGVSGGCPEYPPPQLPVTIGNNIEIDLSALGVTAIG